MLLRWSAERGIPFAASLASSSSCAAAAVASAVASVPSWALVPASRDALDGASSASSVAASAPDASAADAEPTRTLVARAGAAFAWPAAVEGGAGKASEMFLTASTAREQ